MQTSERSSFAETMNAISEYYDHVFSDPVIAMWWEALKPYSAKQFSSAVAAHMRHSQFGRFAPRIADIVREIEGTPDELAQLAWAKVHAAVRRVGNYRSVCFDDARIHVVLDQMGGWGVICSMKSDDAPFRAREFCQRYNALRDDPADYPAYLPGDHEGHNQLHGHTPDLPVLIGDRAAALAVMKSGQRGSTIAISAAPAVASIKHQRPA
jgi:hypothetical protein